MKKEDTGRRNKICGTILSYLDALLRKIQQAKSVWPYFSQKLAAYTEFAHRKNKLQIARNSGYIPGNPRKKDPNRIFKGPPFLWGCMFFLIFILALIFVFQPSEESNFTQESIFTPFESLPSFETIPVGELAPQNDMPAFLQYHFVDKDALHVFLTTRNSILADEPYFQTVLSTSRKYNVHPFLLFAITGQEQGFVPRTHKDAMKIANNPFNVGHSWKEFNTDIEHSANIAANLLVKLASNIPEGQDAFQWINRTYAEDPKWFRGVRAIYRILRQKVSASPIQPQSL